MILPLHILSSFLLQAEGYAEGDTTLYHRFTLMDFLKAPNPVDFLSKANEVCTLARLGRAGPCGSRAGWACHLVQEANEV